jgi:hypothetical protein
VLPTVRPLKHFDVRYKQLSADQLKALEASSNHDNLFFHVP